MNFLDILDKQIKAIHERIDNEKNSRTRTILRNRLGGVVDVLLLYKEYSNWISVTDKLPDENEEVLIYVADGVFGAYTTISHYKPNDFVKWHGIYVNETVTHWQPLPAPPVNSKGE